MFGRMARRATRSSWCLKLVCTQVWLKCEYLSLRRAARVQMQVVRVSRESRAWRRQSVIESLRASADRKMIGDYNFNGYLCPSVKIHADDMLHFCLRARPSTPEQECR
ncbi:uncharacterized protein HD556DRAFT_1398594 [Suillus plorans]|uniref:Secreted protein n=1 Tax=Suillus plorans TaxID=116603 RepID=A0A9P7AGZ2_9AGAM|nr:uncharacterized protein HD556DRAFT_1398594 [Suillus plorans]KAG1789250.1 hypothetical protein HD556DRAFT_1398594 [Suillus plorans]